MQQARHCDDFNALLDVARTFNQDSCMPPLAETEVTQTAQSAWGYTGHAQNRFGQHGSWLPLAKVDALVADPRLMTLIVWLQAHNGPDAEFWVADGLAAQWGWPREQFQQA